MGRSQAVRQRFLVPPSLVRIQAPQPAILAAVTASEYLALWAPARLPDSALQVLGNVTVQIENVQAQLKQAVIDLDKPAATLRIVAPDIAHQALELTQI
jgi:hypothetical protein